MSPRQDGTPVPTRYVAGWMVAAALAVAVAVLLSDRTVWEQVGLAGLAIYLLAVAVAERVQLQLIAERASAAFTLIEVAIAAGLLLLPPPVVVLGTAAGTLLTQVVRGLRGSRAGFNAAIATVGTALAAAIVAITPPVGPLVEGRPVIGALAGMLGYGVVVTAAMGGLLRRFAGAETQGEFRQRLPLVFAGTLGMTAIGVVVAALWVAEPWLAVLALLPTAAIHLAARGSQRSRDLLDQVQTERDRLSLVVDGASDGILLLDHTGAVHLWSRGMQDLTGIAAERAVGARIEDVLTTTVRHASVPADAAALVALLEEGPEPLELAATLRHRDGSEREVQERHALLRDDRGRPRGDVVVVRDVSREAQLARLRGDFVARISHELRSPLTPIQGFARLLRTHDTNLDADKRRDLLDRLVDRTDHLGRLIDDLLLVTKVDAQELQEPVRLHTVDLAAVVSQAVERFRAASPHRDVRLELPDAAPSVRTDPHHVARIITTLLDNADRYAAGAGPASVIVRADSRAATVTVADHGPGIPIAQRDAIFEPFHRLEDPLTMRTGGVGLGLFLGRHLATIMDGALELEPDDGRPGTRFTLRLPVTTDEQGYLRPGT